MTTLGGNGMRTFALVAVAALVLAGCGGKAATAPPVKPDAALEKLEKAYAAAKANPSTTPVAFRDIAVQAVAAINPIQPTGVGVALRRLAATAFQDANAYGDAANAARKGLETCDAQGPALAANDKRNCAVLTLVRSASIGQEKAGDLAAKAKAAAGDPAPLNPAISLEGWTGLRDAFAAYAVTVTQEWQAADGRLARFAEGQAEIATRAGADRAGQTCALINAGGAATGWRKADADTDGSVKGEAMRAYRDSLVLASEKVLGSVPAACTPGALPGPCVTAVQPLLAARCPRS